MVIPTSEIAGKTIRIFIKGIFFFYSQQSSIVKPTWYLCMVLIMSHKLVL